MQSKALPFPILSQWTWDTPFRFCHQQLGSAKLSHNQMCISGCTTNTIQACPWRFFFLYFSLTVQSTKIIFQVYIANLQLAMSPLAPILQSVKSSNVQLVIFFFHTGDIKSHWRQDFFKFNFYEQQETYWDCRQTLTKKLKWLSLPGSAWEREEQEQKGPIFKKTGWKT